MSLVNGTQHIVKADQHFVAIDEYGKFLCSGDTIRECEDELIEMIKAECAASTKQGA